MTHLSILSRRSYVLALIVALFIFACQTTGVEAQTTRGDRQQRDMYEGLEPIAPFIDANTLAVARFDVDRIDYGVFNKTLKVCFERLLTNLQFAEEDAAECRKAFEATATALTNELKSKVEEFKVRTGLADVYYILQTTRGDGACFIAPVGNITAKQQEECKRIAESFHLNCALYQKNFMVATRAPLTEFGAYYRNFKPESNKTLNSAIAKNADKCLAWYCGRLKIRPLFHATSTDGPASARVRQYDPFANSPRAVKALVEAFDASFVDGSGYFDASTLSVGYSLQFTSALNAGRFRNALLAVADAFSNFYFKKIEQDPLQVADASLTPGATVASWNPSFIKFSNTFGIVKEFYAGSFETFVPKQSESRLTFEHSAEQEVAKFGPVTFGLLATYDFIFSDAANEPQFEDFGGSGIQFDSNDMEEFEPSTSPFKRVD